MSENKDAPYDFTEVIVIRVIKNTNCFKFIFSCILLNFSCYELSESSMEILDLR